MIGTALAQVAVAPGRLVIGVPTQGQTAYPPAASPTAYVNNNNNYQAPALPGALANPTPGTMVVHVNGKVQTDFQATWTSLDTRVAAAPAAGSLGAVLGQNGAGSVKVMPQAIDSFARLYMGADAMAFERPALRRRVRVPAELHRTDQQQWQLGCERLPSFETVFVRRAFTYIAGEQWGIVRAGQADGLISIFDNGVTTFQFLPTGNLNGGDATNFAQNASAAFVFMAQAGNEYDNAKIVYMSPQIAGFDFGIQYAPNTSNGNGMGGSNNTLNASITGTGTGTGLVHGSPTPAVRAVVRPRRSGRPAVDQPGGDRRALPGSVRPHRLLAYVVGEGSQHSTYTGLTTAASSATRRCLAASSTAASMIWLSAAPASR